MWRIASTTFLAAALSGGLAGCSLDIASLDDGPDDVTGSITPAAAPAKGFLSDLGPEEVRRAKAALATALDPQGNGQPVRWDNPESRIGGSIVPLSKPFVEHDEVCRRFSVTVVRPRAGAMSNFEGKGCKASADEWVVSGFRAAKTRVPPPI